ncbi:MAG: glycosyltransferase, partial [Bacillota bacterium]
MKISGCIIARNEEANIANCINNMKNVTDEIIVVDTGSEDKTIQIAKELGAFVYEYQWENDFSKAKNSVLDYATGEW